MPSKKKNNKAKNKIEKINSTGKTVKKLKDKKENNNPKQSKEQETQNKENIKTEEKRREERIPAEIEVKYSTGESFAVDWTMNISRGGMFIRTPNPLPPGSNLKIYFSIPETEEEIFVEGVVRWKADPTDPNVLPGMGVEITYIDEKSRRILDEFVRKKLQKKYL
ncbi:MAG: TIGR02266 family protein [Candidatus Calescibacterium sp.]|nr:TIGR02266 family protein [Candidatus Calescibacterium sp.]MCX7734147.1 TIGR02266 family protein [bacterium]MDW8087860.1 TIGR02266 family protein [Candidatus Calescibacterium sp.]